MNTGHPEQPGAAHGFVSPLTEQSDPGIYIVLTASRSLYIAEIISPDRPPQVTRHPARGALLRDGEPLPGVNAFYFDIETGVGKISWWKDDPADFDRPGQPYAGTVRTTNTVLFVARLGDRTPLRGMGLPEDIKWDDVVALVHVVMRGSHHTDPDPA